MQYTRDGQHVTSMINEELGIMPPGTAFGYRDELGKNISTPTKNILKTTLYTVTHKVDTAIRSYQVRTLQK